MCTAHVLVGACHRVGVEPAAQACRRGPRQLVVGQVQVGEGGEGGQERRQLARQLVVGEVQVPAPGESATPDRDSANMDTQEERGAFRLIRAGNRETAHRQLQHTHVLQQGELGHHTRDAARELVVADVQLGQLLQGGQCLGHLALQVVAGDGKLLEVGEGRQPARVGLAEDALDLVVAEVQAADSGSGIEA